MNKENPSQRTDRELGMDRNIPRRDFLNGAAMTIGAALLPGTLSPEGKKIDEPQNQPGYNPPISSGLRGRFSCTHRYCFARKKLPPFHEHWQSAQQAKRRSGPGKYLRDGPNS